MTETIFSGEALVDITGGSIDTAKMIMELFRTDMASSMDELAQKLETGTGDEVHQVVHRIKGAAANVRCGKMAAVAATMDVAAINESAEAAAVHFPALKEALEEVNGAATSYFAG